MTGGWLVHAFRRLGSDRLPAAGFAALVLVTAFVFGLAPRLLDRVADTALRSEVAGASAVTRNIQLLEERRIVADARGPIHGVDVVGERRAADMPGGVQSLIASRTAVIETPRWEVGSETPQPTTTVLRIQQGAEERLRFVAGRAPIDRFDEVDLALPGQPASRWPVLEGALSVAAAEGFGVEVGDRILLGLDPTDPLAGGGHSDRIAIALVGIYELAAPDDPYWFEDGSLVRPSLRAVSADLVYLHAPILLAEASYTPLIRLTETSELPMRYTWRYFVDAARLDGERLDGVAADLRRLDGVFAATPGAAGPARGTQLRSGLSALVGEFRARWRSAEAILLVVAIGPACVAAAAIALVALMAAQRRRATVLLWRGRGASAEQVVAAFGIEALALVGPAAILGAVGAAVLIQDAPLVPTAVAAGVIGLGALVMLVGSSWAAQPGQRDAAAHAGRPSQRRLAIEALIVGLAIVGAILLRDRGLSSAAGGGADPFVAAVPALVALAAGLLAMRLFPLPVGLLGRLAAPGRGLVAVLGLRRAVRAGVAARVLLVLLATASIGAFSSAALIHLDRAAEAAGWHDVGAEFRLADADGVLPSRLDPAALPGVEVAAGAHLARTALAARGLRVDLLAVDAVAYQEVVADTEGDPRLPAELLAAPDPPLPAIVSRLLAAGRDPIALGDSFELVVNGRRTTLRAVEFRDAFPTLEPGSAFVVVSRDHLVATMQNAHLPATTAFLRAPEAAAPRIREALEQRWSTVSLDGRAERTAAIRTSPVTEAVRTGVFVAVAVAAAYAALAVAASIALAGLARAGEVAHLRTFGLTVRQAAALIAVEHGPSVLVAFAAGVALGLGLFVALRPGLGLESLAGTSLDIPIAVDPVQLAAVLGALVASTGLGIAIGAILQRAAEPAASIRRGLQ